MFRESFGFGANYQRPKSGKGRMTPVFVATGIAGFWAEYPATKNNTWMGLDVSGTASWTFAAATPNPMEDPTPMQPDGSNGTAFCINDLGPFQPVDLLVPMNSPKTKFSITAELGPRPVVGHYTGIGLTNANVLEDNFETSATVWVRLLAQETGVQGTGLAEFRTNGLAGPSVSGVVPVDFNGFTHVEIIVDPVRQAATATVSGVPLGTLRIPAGTTKYVGFEGSGMADNLVVKVLP